MIFENVELHNFEEVVYIEGRQGKLLCRIPEYLNPFLRPGTQEIYKRPAGAEIRFVSDWKPAKVTLACYNGKGLAVLYFGNYQAGIYPLTEEPTTIEIPVPQFLPYLAESYGTGTFSPEVRRLILDGGEIHLIGVEGENIRPPKKCEVPQQRYLAYGTSITHGVAATNPMLSYVKQTAWRLGMDAINYGVSGNAFCEAKLADYLADRKDWDIATICVSVNMLNQGVSRDEFCEKAGYLTMQMAKRNPDKPVICIGLFPFYMDRGMRLPDRTYISTECEYRETLKSIVAFSRCPNLHYMDGRNLLKRFDGLSSDFLHPGDLGMIEIGENLAGYIRELNNCRL